eukprot:SAG31_NODE_229_length_19770_cov_9.887194_20_plen_169_part_00
MDEIVALRERDWRRRRELRHGWDELADWLNCEDSGCASPRRRNISTAAAADHGEHKVQAHLVDASARQQCLGNSLVTKSTHTPEPSAHLQQGGDDFDNSCVSEDDNTCASNGRDRCTNAAHHSAAMLGPAHDVARKATDDQSCDAKASEQVLLRQRVEAKRAALLSLA